MDNLSLQEAGGRSEEETDFENLPPIPSAGKFAQFWRNAFLRRGDGKGCAAYTLTCWLALLSFLLMMLNIILTWLRELLARDNILETVKHVLRSSVSSSCLTD